MTGDWGVSVVRYPERVDTLVFDALLYTLSIVGVALALSFIIGSYLGILLCQKARAGTGPVLAIDPDVYRWLSLLLVSDGECRVPWFSSRSLPAATRGVPRPDL